MDKQEVIERCRRDNVAFVRLQFTELYGPVKNVSIPVDELEKALDNELMFDGSSIRGFKRIEQSDMYFLPDPDTYTVLPWRGTRLGPHGPPDLRRRRSRRHPVRRRPAHEPEAGAPEGADLGYDDERRPRGRVLPLQARRRRQPHRRSRTTPPPTSTSLPLDRGEDCRRDIELTLQQMGFYLEAAHHEVAIGQHEIDFRHADALATADNLVTFRMVVKVIAARHGMHATFMAEADPRRERLGHAREPVARARRRERLPRPQPTCSALSRGPQLHRGACSSTCRRSPRSPTRPSTRTSGSCPGYEAPVYIAWSPGNRSAAIRVPAKRGRSTRIELRTPDPTANPYLALACMLEAGLDGISRGLQPPRP